MNSEMAYCSVALGGQGVNLALRISSWVLGWDGRKEGRRLRDVREPSVREKCYHSPLGRDKYLNSCFDFYGKKITVDVTKKFGLLG